MVRADRAQRIGSDEGEDLSDPRTADTNVASAPAVSSIRSMRPSMSEPAPSAEARAPSPAPAQTPTSEPASTDAASESKTRMVSKKAIIIGAGLLAILAAAWFGISYFTVGRYMMNTDDAYVRADVTNVAAKVSGYVVTFEVKENDFVKAGQVIVKIDGGDYKIALDAARAKANTQRATTARIAAQIAAQDSAILQAEAGLASAKADARRTELDYQRYSSLAKSQFGTQQRFEQAEADRNKAVAQVRSSQAQIASAEANKTVLQAQKVEAERTLDELETQVAKAERDLAATEIRAPVNGQFGNKSVQVGAWVNPGSRIGALVATDSLYIEANYKETQLQRMRPGQTATIGVDALSGKPIVGTVESVAPGAGAIFSLLPPENATGNFTKIVQRVPVRIRLPKGAADNIVLRPGLSVVATVDTRKLDTAAAANAAAPMAAK